jgi:hypothetical protein
MRATDRRSSTDMVMTALCATVVLVAIAFEFYARKNRVVGPYWNFFSRDFFVQYGLLSLGVFHAWMVRNWREIAAVAAAAAVSAVLIQAAHLDFVRSDMQLIAYAVALGSACVQLFGIAGSLNDREASLMRLRMARDCLTFAVAVAIPSPILQLSMSINPTLDHVVAQFDDSLGIRLISVTRWVMVSSPYLREFMIWVYGCVPVAVVVMFAVQRPVFPPVPLTVWVSSVIGFTLYFFVPVVGPSFTYPDYYASLWPTMDAYVGTAPVAVTDRPRNCMPSLHATWAFLIVFAAYGIGRPVMLSVVILAFLTLLSAIEIGNHWFTDLVVALPFALAMQALASYSLPLRTPERLTAIIGGSGLTTGLLVLMAVQPLVFPFSVAVHWAIMLVASCVTLILWRRLARRMVREHGEAAPREMPPMRLKNEAA